MFLIEKGTPGFTVGRALDKHGWRSSDTAELHFDGCRIPVENRLGDEGRGVATRRLVAEYRVARRGRVVFARARIGYRMYRLRS